MTSSRAGDRFHYVWAAVQSLQMLDRRSELVEVWIEGAAGGPAPGDEIIDIAEYYAAPGAPVDRVVVRQLKYSTKRVSVNLGLSELGSTLRKFAQIDAGAHIALRVPTGATARYMVTSNRPIAPTLLNAIAKIVNGEGFRPNSNPAKILAWLQLEQSAAADLLSRISFDGAGASLATLRSQLDVLTAELSGEPDTTVPSVLIEQVSKRASAELVGPINLATVAMVFGTTQEDLLPAPSLLQRPQKAVARDVYRQLADHIMACDGPTIISAVGGAGKSTFAAALPDLLADRAVVIVYDCFGNGSYRSPATPRHRHQDGLIQITSELAALALCSPIVSRSTTAAAELVRAFIRRLQEAQRRTTEAAPGTALVVVIDAADNAVIAADGRGEWAFVKDLLRVEPIPGVHIVLTARPYRVQSLDRPPGVHPITLPEFSLVESAALLRTAYPAATEEEAAEFHRRTSGNPRVQALALSVGPTLDACLAALTGFSPNGTDVVEQFLGRQLDTLLDDAGSDRGKLEFTAQLLATLRPRIPVSVLARLAEADEALIRSFASDVGRGLLVEDDAIQFLDEPTETFFRNRFPLTSGNADPVITQLRNLSATHPYAAASLPQVLWEADRFQELVDLALSDDDLPDSGEVARRQIAQLRASFALRAAIRQGDPAGIVELAMVAGSTAASSERRYTLLRDNPDLTGEVLDPTTLDDLRAARLFPDEWPGSVLTAEAVMLAAAGGRDADGLSRLRAATAASRAWLSLSRKKRKGRMETRHGGDIALARVLLLGEESAAEYLDGWRPASWEIQQAQRVTAILLSRGEMERVTRLGTATRSQAVTLGIAAEAQRIGSALSSAHTERAWGILRGTRVDIDHNDVSSLGVSDLVYRGVAWVAAAAVRTGVASARQAVNLLTKYVPANPPAGLGEPHGRENTGLLHAYSLRAVLRNRSLTVAELEPAPGSRGVRMSDADKAQLDRILPWLQEWARWALGEADETSTIATLTAYPASRTSYQDPILLRRIAGPMSAQFARTSTSEDVATRFRELLATANDHSGLFVAVDMIASLQGDTRFVDAAYASATAAATSAQAERQNADQMADDLVRVARAVYAYDHAEAHAYFGRAVEIVARVGDDAWQHWEAVVALADIASVQEEHDAFLVAAHVARVLEELEPYLYNGVDTRKLVAALQHLAGPRALAILSRWQDARFGHFTGMFGQLFDQDDGVLAGHPVLRVALSPLTPAVRIGAELRELDEAGNLTATTFTAAQQLVHAAGEEITADDVGAALAMQYHLPSSRPPRDEDHIVSSFDSPDFETAQEEKLVELRATLQGLDLGAADGMALAAAAMDDGPVAGVVEALVEEISTRPPNTWAAILDAFGSEDSFSAWDRTRFISSLQGLQSSSQAFAAARKRLAENYLRRHPADVTSGSSFGAEPQVLAEMLQTDESSVLTTALGFLDADAAVATSDACYRLAGTVASLLTPADAVRALEGALSALESVLEAEPWTTGDVDIPTTRSAPESVVAVLWSALADPRAAIRWRATHAVRYLILTGDDEAIAALATTVAAGAPAGYTDPKFPFYQLHAIEGFLVSAERAAIENPARMTPLLAAIAELQQAHPDHIRVQEMCLRIAQRCDDQALAAAAEIVRHPTEAVDRWDRPSAPTPFGHGAVTSEFSFAMDFDEYAIAPLSESFVVDHEEVVRAMSDLILDEWGYRDSPLLEKDPRRAAGAYEREETYFYKSDFPKSDDVDYYLSYHALLTIAGRLNRTKTGYRDPEEGTDAVDEWLHDFTLARRDRRWLADARRPVPTGHQRRSHDYRGDWVWRVSADDFPREFLNDDGWIAVRSFAYQSEYRSWDNTFVSSALVALETAPALMRALQSAPSFRNHRLPSTGDRDFTFDTGPFQLYGWIDSSDATSGADSRDEFARDIHYPTPRPSEWVRDLLDLTAIDDGLGWTRNGVLAAQSESWTQSGVGREDRGPNGGRLRITPSLLEDLSTRTGMAVLVEVRLDRFDERLRDSSERDDSMGYIDDYVRFFLFSPDDGWRDARGAPVAR